MYRKILAAVNEHLNSEVAARYALHLARELDARLYICFVAERGMSAQNRLAAEEAMHRLFNVAVDQNVQAESIAETGEPLNAIGRLVRHEHIGLVFASTRREDVQRRFYAGTVARGLSLKLPCSVALVRVVHSGRLRPRRILAPLKARVGHVRERAFFAAHMARAFASKVFVFHAPDPVHKFFQGEIHLDPPEWERRTSGDILQFMEQLRHFEVVNEGKLLPGRAAHNITIEAFHKRHDLIIMGASERSLLKSLLTGSPVEDVLRETPCDLIILRPRHED